MQYHPDPYWLEQYAAGALALPYSLCVAVHLTYCAPCRRRVASLQSVGGALLEQIPPRAVGPELLDNVFAAIDAGAGAAATVPAQPQAAVEQPPDVPKPLRPLVPGGYEQLRWRWLLPSVKEATLDLGDPRYRVALHRINPGGKVAQHDHRGEELTLVLNGAFSDEFGVYGSGDFLLRGPQEEHCPRAAENEPCLCLTVQEAPVRFTGPFARLLNPLLR